MAEVVLELEFKDIADRSYRLKIDEPRDNLSGAEVGIAMNEILVSEVFTNGGRELVSIEGARTITTTVSEIAVD